MVYYVQFVLLTVASAKMATFKIVAQYSLVEANQRLNQRLRILYIRAI